MKTNGIIESFGVLLKEETLQTVEHYIIENTLVLESIEPFPGYHGENQPVDTRPDSLFLITDKQYPIESIFRTSQHICCYQGLPVNACPVEITLMNSTYHGIRIRGLGNYTLIPEIQECYMKKDIRFMKMKSLHSPALLRIIKIFRIQLIENQIYKDLEDDSTFYFAIPYHFTWEKFKQVTMSVKNNLDNSNFDAASGFVYQKELIELVRIYIK